MAETKPIQENIYAQIQAILANTNSTSTVKNQKIITILNENVEHINPQWIFNASATGTSIPLAHLLARLEYKHDQWEKLIGIFSQHYDQTIIQGFINQADATQNTVLSNESIGSNTTELLIAHGANPFLGENGQCAFRNELLIKNKNIGKISCMLTSITKNRTIYESAKQFFQYRDIDGNSLFQYLLKTDATLFTTTYNLLINLKTSITEDEISPLLNFCNPNNNRDSIYHLLAASSIEITLLEHEKVLAKPQLTTSNNQGQTPLTIANISGNLPQFLQTIGMSLSDIRKEITSPLRKRPTQEPAATGAEIETKPATEDPCPSKPSSPRNGGLWGSLKRVLTGRTPSLAQQPSSLRASTSPRSNESPPDSDNGPPSPSP